MQIHTIYWNQKPFSEFIYNTFLSLVPSLLNPKTPFERTPWGFILGDERGIYIERRPSLAYATTYDTYLQDLLKVLILMAKFGLASDIYVDNLDAEYLLALEEVHTMYPLLP